MRVVEKTCWSVYSRLESYFRISCWIRFSSVRNKQCWQLEASFGDIRFPRRDQQRGEALPHQIFWEYPAPPGTVKLFINIHVCWTEFNFIEWSIVHSSVLSELQCWPGNQLLWAVPKEGGWPVYRVSSLGLNFSSAFDRYPLLLWPGVGGTPYMHYRGMCGPKRYGFSVVLVINRVSVLAILALNRISVLYSSLELDNVV